MQNQQQYGLNNLDGILNAWYNLLLFIDEKGRQDFEQIYLETL